MVEVAPVFVFAATILRANPKLPIALDCEQWQAFSRYMEPLLGVNEHDLVISCVHDKDLFFARELIQPVFPTCGVASPAMIRHLRSLHLLPPDGLPIFGNGWRPRRPHATALSGAAMARIPDDWVVVLAKRKFGGKRRLEGFETVQADVERLFGRERVRIFDGSLSLFSAKRLFNRAALFVGAHGAALTNVLFMPARSCLFEIRPMDYPNACYHHLAHACDVRYFLVIGRGSKDTPLRANASEISRVLRQISSSMKLPGRDGSTSGWAVGGGRDADVSDNDDDDDVSSDDPDLQ